MKKMMGKGWDIGGRGDDKGEKEAKREVKGLHKGDRRKRKIQRGRVRCVRETIGRKAEMIEEKIGGWSEWHLIGEIQWGGSRWKTRGEAPKTKLVKISRLKAERSSADCLLETHFVDTLIIRQSHFTKKLSCERQAANVTLLLPSVCYFEQICLKHLDFGLGLRKGVR